MMCSERRSPCLASSTYSVMSCCWVGSDLRCCSLQPLALCHIRESKIGASVRTALLPTMASSKQELGYQRWPSLSQE